VFPAPAPAGPYPDPQLLSVFNGLNPNGTWSLYVLDDTGFDVGSLTGGWSLTVTVSQSTCCSQPCTLVCPDPIVQYNDGPQSNALVAFTPGVVGNCGVVNCTPPSSSIFPLGTTIDSCQSVSVVSSLPTGACTFPVTIADVAPPLITGEVASPFLLAPANGKLVDVAVNYQACDNCRVPGATDQPPPACSLTVKSNEPQRGTGRRDKSPDWQVIDAHRVRLRAERSAKGDGRVYTIGITCRDKAGNRTSREVKVTVPR
jgi:hypothetical protein